MPYSPTGTAKRVQDERAGKPLSKPKWEEYAAHRAAGCNKTKAAILVGFAEKSAAVRGCELEKKPEVKNRIEQIRNSSRERAISTVNLSKSLVLEELWKNVKRAAAGDDNSSVNRGLELIGKELGMFVDRKIVGVQALIAELTPENLRIASTEDLVRLVGTLESVLTSNEQKLLSDKELDDSQ